MTKPNEPACTECSRLASRVEELEKSLRQMVALVRACPELPIAQILESDDLIEAVGLNPWCVNEGIADGNDLHDIANCNAVMKAERLLAGAHAEEKD